MCDFAGDNCETAAQAEREVIVDAINQNWDSETDELISKHAVIELIESLG